MTRTPIMPSVSRSVTSICAVAIACLITAGAAHGDDGGLTPAQRAQLPRHFGFKPLEIFKLDHGITQLRTADFNGDGATDIVVANNRKSTIEVLIQRSSPPEATEEPEFVNDLVSGWRFDRKRVSIAWRIHCLRVGDVNADGHQDIVFFGDPSELVILLGRGDGTFKDPVTRRIRDGLNLSSGVDLADLNADGRTDIVVLAASDVLIFFQTKTGGVGNPVRYAHAVDHPSAIRAEDLDGNSHADLILVTSEREFPMHVRYQDRTGQLGPVHRVKIPMTRGGTFASCLGRKQVDFFGVERLSGRLKRWVFDAPTEPEPDEKWAVSVYPLPGKTDSEQRPIAVGDVNGDGRADVIAANVEAAQLALFTQRPHTGLGQPKLYGGQVEMADIRIFDADGDGAGEVYVVSPGEETVGQSVWGKERLRFPKPIPTLDTPHAMDVGPLTDRGEVCVVYVSANEDDEYQLVIQALSAKGADKDSEPKRTLIELEDIEDPPAGMRIVDVNRDGLKDIVVFAAYGPMVTAVQDDGGDFSLLSEGTNAQTGLVKDVTPASFAYADIDDDGKREVLLAQGAFVRALAVNERGAWETMDQFNGPTSDADITGVCTVQLDPRKGTSLAMYDKKSHEVHIYSRGKDGIFSLDRSVLVGALQLRLMDARPMAGDGHQTIMLADSERVVLITPGTPAARAQERAVYESSIEDAWLTRIAVGDVNSDGITDVLVIDTRERFIEILTFGPDDSLVRANKFRVFTEKQFHAREQEGSQPHWIEIADVTNDGRDDLLIIAHDRILLYPS